MVQAATRPPEADPRDNTRGGHTFAAVAAGREHLDLPLRVFGCLPARIAGREACHGIPHDVGDPDAVLLVDGKMEWEIQLAWAVLVGLEVGGFAVELQPARDALGRVLHSPAEAAERLAVKSSNA